MQKASGFTLMELMIVIAIVAVISAISIPYLIGWFPQYRLSTATRDMVSTFQMARLKAIKTNADIVVAINLATDSYTVFQDDSLNWVLDGAERQFTTRTLPPGIDITAASFGGATSVRFDRRGFPQNVAGNSTNGSVTFDNGRGTVHSVVSVILDISGNARLP
jgi:type IV fimbrial biogenesis protein FimT